MSDLDLYHRTTPEAAASILRKRRMTSKERGDVFFSTHYDGENAGGYGSAVVHVRVPEHLAELDDEFPDGEQHYRMRNTDLQPHHFVGVRAVKAGLIYEHHKLEGGRHRILAISPDDKPVGSIEYRASAGDLHVSTHRARTPEAHDGLFQEMLSRHPGHLPYSAEPEPEPQKPEPTTWYHGTTVPNLKNVWPAEKHRKHVVFPQETSRSHAYATSDEDDAWNYAEKAWGSTEKGRPRVYEVQPHGSYEKDPTYNGDVNRGNQENDYRSQHGWKVVRELPWSDSGLGEEKDWDPTPSKKRASAEPVKDAQLLRFNDGERDEDYTGGSKWQNEGYIRAQHPEHGEVGHVQYLRGGRVNSPIRIKNLQVHPDHQRKGYGSALMDELQRQFPRAKIDHGDRTDQGKAWWDSYGKGSADSRGRTSAAQIGRTVHVRLADIEGGYSGIHRGIAVGLSAEDHEIVHDPEVSAHVRARHLLDAVTREGYEPLGQHWSTDPKQADHFSSQYAQGGHRERGAQTQVVFHAAHPEHHEIEHDENWRAEHEVNDLEDEVPLRHGADVELHGVSWRKYVPPGGGQREPWNHVRLGEPEYHTASARIGRTINVPAGGPTTVRYVRNPASSQQHGNFGEQYAQHVEPAGRYLSERSGDHVPEGWESGEVHFHNPLHLPWGGSYREPSNWKHELSRRFEGATGPALSRAVADAGHDGIVTHDEYGTSEIVDLTHLHRRTSGLARRGVSVHASVIPPEERCPVCGSLGEDPTDPGSECIPCDGSGHAVCPVCDEDVRQHPLDGWQHLDGSISHNRSPLSVSQAMETLNRTADVQINPEHADGDPSTWSEDYHRFVREKPHAAAVSVAQEHARTHLPTMNIPLGSEDDATSACQHLLRRGGHPLADEGSAHEHPNLDWGQSQAYRSEGRFPAVAIHPSRWDYGTLAHEVAHHLHEHHDLGGRKAADDAEAHGPDFVRRYQDVLSGFGRHGHEELGKAYDAALARNGQHTAKKRPTERAQNCQYGKHPATKSLLWAEGMGYIPVCDAHEQRARDHLAAQGDDVAGVHKIAFTPTQRIFGPTQGLDHRLWEGDHLRHDVSNWVLGTLNGFWEPLYGSTWPGWARVYFAGSEASEWTSEALEGNNDFDILVGVHYAHARAYVPVFVGLTDEEITTHLNEEFRAALIPVTDPSIIPVEGQPEGPFSVTWYVNQDSWDIRDIKPYAAYNVSADTWAVRPPHLPDWSIDSFPPAVVAEARAVQAYVEAVLALPEPMRSQQADALWRHLHGDRSRAFSTHGEGWYDPGNMLEKWLDQAGLWEQLAEAHFAAVADPAALLAPAGWSNEPLAG